MNVPAEIGIAVAGTVIGFAVVYLILSRNQ